MNPFPRLRSLGPLLVILVWPLLLFLPGLVNGLVLAPGDGWGQYLPQRVLTASVLRAGEWPFWNPFQFGGMPLLAVSQTGVFFPANWLFLLLPTAWAMNVCVLLAYWVGGGVMFAYVRALACPPAAALLAALVFTGSGFMLANMEHLTVIQAAGLIPAIFWAVERLRTGPWRPAAAWLAALLALQIFAGYPQLVWMTLLLGFPYAAWRLPPEARGPALGAVLCGIGLAAVQWLPTLGLLAESQRHTLSYAEVTADALPVRELATLVFPYLYGTLDSTLFQVPFWGKGPWRNELMGYAGLATLMLALTALRRGRHDGLVRFWWLVGGLGLLLALGDATPLYRVWHALPVFNMIRVPGRHLMELDLALAVLAALGLTHWLQASPGDRQRALRGAGVLLGGAMALVAGLLVAGREVWASRWLPYAPAGVDLGAALAPHQAWLWVQGLALLASLLALARLAQRPTSARQGGLLGVLALDLLLFSHHQGWRGLCPSAAELPRLPILQPHDGPRLLAISSLPYPYHDRALSVALAYPQISTLMGLKMVNGYEPLLAASYSRLVGQLTMGGQLADPHLLASEHHGLDLLACTRVRLDPAALTPAVASHLKAPRWLAEAASGRVRSFVNRRACPRVWRPAEVQVLPEAQRWARLTHDARFEPLREALLETPLGAAVTPGTASLRSTGFASLAGETSGSGPGLVVVSEAYHAGWHAFHGERELPVLRVDGLLLGVAVPAGHVPFTLHYRPPGWWLALALSLGAAGAALLLLWPGWRSRRGRPIPPGRGAPGGSAGAGL
ncbi:MAG: hypothetical protein VKP62_15900 [Candidatus Sericytochromatia bacterium]|nr:hypothetical protein [Candidatus Sericytochromatia bacterium]